MGFKKTLTIRHVTGLTFTVDVDANADCIGVKVLIWEAQKIPLENQRLVFNGKQIDDSAKLAELGVRDGDTIFLVESVDSAQAVEVNAAAAQVRVEPVAVPVAMPIPVASVVRVNVQNKGYAPLEMDESVESQEKMDAVFHLAKWIRAYFVFVLVLCVLAFLASIVFGAWIGVILQGLLITAFSFGVCGTRKVNACSMVPAMILMAFFGFMGLLGAIVAFVYGGFFAGLGPLIGSIINILIFSCIVKLICRINRLSDNEKMAVRTRIKTQTKCCCCTRRNRV